MTTAAAGEGYPPRALRRRLPEDSTTYRALALETRLPLAVELLRTRGVLP